jgi:hypothetical protein
VRGGHVCNIFTINEIMMSLVRFEYASAKRQTGRRISEPETACLSADNILRYLLILADDQDQERVENHIFLCPSCHARVEGMRMGFELALEGDDDLTTEPVATK